MRTIAVVDWNWAGHHPSYFNHLILALEELGVDVLALCPNPGEAEATANETRKPSEGGGGRRGETQFGKLQTTSRRFEKVRPSRVSAIDWTIRHFRGIERQAREWSAKSGRDVDAIFYACMYDWDFEWIRSAEMLLRKPWVGHYLHAMSYRMPGKPHSFTGRVPCPEKMFNGRLCKGITLLDETIATTVSSSIGKPVVAMPDLTDERLPVNGEECKLGNELRAFAAGRPIVGLFGHLQRSKGILTFLEAARASAGMNVCFALAGEMKFPSDPKEKAQIQQALAECPNLWSHLSRIPTETQLNHLLSTCDVLFAAYLDFPHSSGILTKAAVFKKPIIVSDGYLMAERVRRYGIGEVVPQENAPATLESILKITRNLPGWTTEKQPKWNDFCREHSAEKLKDSMATVLTLI